MNVAYMYAQNRTFNVHADQVRFVCFTSHQQSFSNKGTGLPGLNQY